MKTSLIFAPLAVPVTLSEPVPFTTLALAAGPHLLIVSDQVPDTSELEQSGRSVCRLPASDFKRLADRAFPAIGREPRQRRRELSTCQWANLARDHRCVPPVMIARGIGTVDPQAERWSCGVNSGARFAAMLGQSIANYGRFRDSAPGYGIGPFNLVGPGPERLLGHLRRQSELHHSDIGARLTESWGPQAHIIQRALNLGRPSLVLLVRGELEMHWVNVVAQHRATGNFVILDTDGGLSYLPEGEQELEHEMNAGRCLAQGIGAIGRYSSITCTERCTVNDPLGDFDPNYYMNRYPDLRAAFGSREPETHRIAALARHFIDHGIAEGRSAHHTIHFPSYLARYPDLQLAFGVNGLNGAAQHWYRHGRSEGRDCRPA